MDNFQLSSLSLLLISTGIFAEACSFALYKRYQVRLRRLSGTGRLNDIEVAQNWRRFFSAAMFLVPVLLYMIKTAIMPS